MNFWKILIEPRSIAEDDARREYILNILLVSLGLLLAVFSLIVIVERLFIYHEAGSASPFAIVSATIVIWILLYISRASYFRFSATLLICLGWVAVLYTNLSRGMDLPMSWMFYGLLVYIASIVVSSRFAILFTFAASAGFLLATYMMVAGFNPFFVRDWRVDGFQIPDALGFAVSLGAVAVVSWLSSREIDRSLARARASEAALKAERDSLEIKVQERTRELKEEQRERFESIALFADFGKHASGVLHDLANPLTSMSLNLQQAKDADPESQKRMLERVIKGAERMEALLRTARTQFCPTAEESTINVAKEAEQAVEILSHLARVKKVRFDLADVESLEAHGSPYSFNRVLLNLMSNAMEAYDGLERPNAVVRVRARRENDEGVVTVEDDANGIPPEVMPKLFEPFASSKIGKGGTGMGLATAKSLAERDFRGTLSAESTPGKGSRFTFRFPLRTDT